MRVILLVVAIAFVMNGCLADRIKQRLYYLKTKDKYTMQKKAKASQKAKVVSSFNREEKSRVYKATVPARSVYKPSKVKRQEVEVEEIPINTKEVTKKSSVSQVKKSTPKKKRKSTASKKEKTAHKKRKTHSKKVKVIKEPYSLESDKQDPELLGPQTTLNANPLLEDGKDKI